MCISRCFENVCNSLSSFSTLFFLSSWKRTKENNAWAKNNIKLEHIRHKPTHTHIYLKCGDWRYTGTEYNLNCIEQFVENLSLSFSFSLNSFHVMKVKKNVTKVLSTQSMNLWLGRVSNLSHVEIAKWKLNTCWKHEIYYRSMYSNIWNEIWKD